MASFFRCSFFSCCRPPAPSPMALYKPETVVAPPPSPRSPNSVSRSGSLDHARLITGSLAIGILSQSVRPRASSASENDPDLVIPLVPSNSSVIKENRLVIDKIREELGNPLLPPGEIPAFTINEEDEANGAFETQEEEIDRFQRPLTQFAARMSPTLPAPTATFVNTVSAQAVERAIGGVSQVSTRTSFERAMGASDAEYYSPAVSTLDDDSSASATPRESSHISSIASRPNLAVVIEEGEAPSTISPDFLFSGARLPGVVNED